MTINASYKLWLLVLLLYVINAGESDLNGYFVANKKCL